MTERINAELGLVDAWTAQLGGPRTAKLLGRLDQAVAWDKLVAPIAFLRLDQPVKTEVLRLPARSDHTLVAMTPTW